MKKYLSLLMLVSFYHISNAQMDLPPSGGNPRAKVTEEVGITDITVRYSRPDVSGREGKIWGSLVPWGFGSDNLGVNKSISPWRTGANENTAITFEHDVKVQGRDVKAGTYGLFFAVWPDSATLILSNQSEAWGSFYYDSKNDALRVPVKPVAVEKSQEWLTFEFIEQREKYCVIALKWEKLMIPFRVDVDVDNIVLARLRDQVTGQRGFNAALLLSAAQWCVNKNINLEEALQWSIRAANLRNYNALRNLAVAYEKLNRLPQADSVMKDALTMANPNQYVAYGRALITQKRNDKAMEVMLENQKKNGDVYLVNSGLVFGYSAKGDYKKAQAAAEKAMAQAPNDNAKKTIEGQITKLKEGKDINIQ
jgi:hypothetical protein